MHEVEPQTDFSPSLPFYSLSKVNQQTRSNRLSVCSQVQHTHEWAGRAPVPAPRSSAHFFPVRNLCRGPPPAISMMSIRASAWQTPMSRTM